MHSDPKQDAQKAEDAGLTAQPAEAAPRSEAVAKMDEPSIEAAGEKERQDSSPRLIKQDKLDLERAAGEGMTPPSHP